MKPETLDALLIDRSLGELSPEVEELLLAYLEADPAAAGRQTGLDATLRTARESVALKLDRPRRTTPFAELSQGRPWRPRVRIAWPEILRLAAGLAAGIVLGWQITRGPGAPKPESSTALHAVAALGESKPSPAGFWSVTRALAQTDGRAARRQDRGPAGSPLWRRPGK